MVARAAALQDGMVSLSCSFVPLVSWCEKLRLEGRTKEPRGGIHEVCLRDSHTLRARSGGTCQGLLSEQ